MKSASDLEFLPAMTTTLLHFFTSFSIFLLFFFLREKELDSTVFSLFIRLIALYQTAA